MGRALAPALLLLAACAPTAPPAAGVRGDARPPEVRQGVNNEPGYEFVIAADRSSVALALPAGVERAWEAVLEGYRRAGVPLADVDTERREVGNRSLRLRARLGEEPLSRFLECGRILGGPIADLYRVQLSVVSTLEAVDAGSTRLVTRVGGTAADPGSSSRPVACGSTGELEKRIAALAAVALGGR